jgi:hypothetical protein
MQFSLADAESLWRISIEHSLWLSFAVAMCALSVYGLYSLACDNQTGKSRVARKIALKEEVRQFAPGYFTLLTIQTIPLFVAGLAIGDFFIILTRGAMLAAVIVVFGISLNKDGELSTWQNKTWIFCWLVIIMSGMYLWHKYPDLQLFVREHEQSIVWTSDATMLLFLFFGQRGVATQLREHYLRGGDTYRRFMVQIERWLYFFPQVVYYAAVPSAATPIVLPFLGWKVDPVLLNTGMGLAGVTMVLGFAIYGMVAGKAARTRLAKQEKFEHAVVSDLR